MANDTLNALQSLGVFEGRPIDERNRALLLAGLNMLKPADTPAMQIGQGIEAGLGVLDQADASRAAAQQQTFENQLKTQEVGATVTKANAAKTTANAEAERKRAQTALDKIFAPAELKKLDAQAVERYSRARLNDRLPQESAGGGGSVSNADITLAQYEANKNYLLATKPMQYTGPDDPRLHKDAWDNTLLAQGTANSDQIAFVAQSPGDAAQVGRNLQAIINPDKGGTPPPDELQTLGMEMMKWTKEDILKAAQAGDPRFDRVLELYPGVAARLQQVMKGE